jgi:cell division protein FtsB
VTRRLADRRQRRRQRALFWGLVAGLLFYALFGGDHRPHHLVLLALQERQTEARITELRQQNRALLQEHDRLAEDPFTLESLAREKGMVRPGDIVYRIVEVPPGVREVAAESLAARARRAASAAADSAAGTLLPGGPVD